METMVCRFACDFYWPDTGTWCCAPVDGCPERFCPGHCAAFHPPHGETIPVVVSFTGTIVNPRRVRVIHSLEG